MAGPPDQRRTSRSAAANAAIRHSAIHAASRPWPVVHPPPCVDLQDTAVGVNETGCSATVGGAAVICAPCGAPAAGAAIVGVAGRPGNAGGVIAGGWIRP